MAKEEKNWWDADLWELINRVADTTKQVVLTYFDELKPRVEQSPQENLLEKLARLETENTKIKADNRALFQLVAQLKQTRHTKPKIEGIIYMADFNKRAVVITNREKIVSVSRYFLELFGYKKEEIVGKKYSDFLELNSLDGLDSEGQKWVIIRALSKQRKKTGFFKVKGKDGSKRMRIDAEVMYEKFPFSEKESYLCTCAEISEQGWLDVLFGWYFKSELKKITKEYSIRTEKKRREKAKQEERQRALQEASIKYEEAIAYSNEALKKLRNSKP